MTRTYSSRRRVESAERTRQSIVEAAVKLHGEGVLTLAAVAEEAGVSLPTVNKYFPTREDLFDACTTHFGSQLAAPSPETLMAISDPGERLRHLVRETYNLHELAFGHNWTGYKLEGESRAIAEAIAYYESLFAALTDTLSYDDAIGDKETVMRFVRAMLNPLTHRALRLKNGLAQEKAIEYMTLALAGVLNIKV